VELFSNGANGEKIIEAGYWAAREHLEELLNLMEEGEHEDFDESQSAVC
jgi:hypothetical protein